MPIIKIRIIKLIQNRAHNRVYNETNNRAYNKAHNNSKQELATTLILTSPCLAKPLH